MPMPKDNEKNACDKAPLITAGVILDTSGIKKNLTPKSALSRVRTYITITSNIINKVGINIFDARSIPSLTPATSIKLTIPATTIIPAKI